MFQTVFVLKEPIRSLNNWQAVYKRNGAASSSANCPMGHSQGSRSVLFSTSSLLGTSPVTLLPSGTGLRILGGPEGQVSHLTGTSCRPLCQDASVVFYLLELKGPERSEQRVPLCGPRMVLAALQACVAPKSSIGWSWHTCVLAPTHLQRGPEAH